MITLKIVNAALCEVPIYEHHKRGVNWCACIGDDPRAPGGLARLFWKDYELPGYAVHPGALVGAALEFGSDYYTTSGKRVHRRKYYAVVEVCADSLLLVEYNNGLEAINAAKGTGL